MRSYAYLQAYEIHLKFLTFQIHFRLDDPEQWKQYQFVIQEMMDQICRLEIVEPQEIPEVCY